MRLDLFLKVSRLCHRRTVAQKLCDAGLVSINGSPSKAAHPVKVGDDIIIHRGDKVTAVRVVSVPDRNQVSKAAASSLFEQLSEQVPENGMGR